MPAHDLPSAARTSLGTGTAQTTNGAPRHHLVVPLPPSLAFPWLGLLAQAAETAGWSALLTDGVHDSVTLLAALAPLTRRIGLVAAIDPGQTPPYTAARRLASLDHISGGRCGWRLTGNAPAAQQADYADAVRALWDSWAEDTHRIDTQAGRYIDVDRIRPADHHGPFYQTRGPLDIPRPIQGHPVLYSDLPQTHPDLRLVQPEALYDADAPGRHTPWHPAGDWPLRLADTGAATPDSDVLYTLPPDTVALHAAPAERHAPDASVLSARLRLPHGRPDNTTPPQASSLRTRLSLPRPAVRS